MVKPLSSKELERRKLIRKAVNDYFGAPINPVMDDKIYSAILKRNFSKLNGYEVLHAKHIADNIKDADYTEALLWA